MNVKMKMRKGLNLKKIKINLLIILAKNYYFKNLLILFYSFNLLNRIILFI